MRSGRVREQSKLLKGRQIIALMYESFRARDRLDMIVSLDFLIKVQYQGDQKMNVFKQSDTALRDTLYSKIKESPALKQELCVHYDMLNYDDPERSYQKLLHIMDRCIRRNRENRNQQQISSGLNLMVAGKEAMSALPAKVKGGGKGNGTPSDKKSNKTDNENAAPVLPQSKAKAHSKAKAKGKPEKGKQAESTDGRPNMKHVRCKFFFSEHGECKNGDRCPFSHSKKPPERGRSSTPGRRRTPENSPSSDNKQKVCFNFKKNGSCSRDNCPYAHVNPATPAEGDNKPEAKAKAKAKTKPEATAEAKGKAKAKGKPQNAAPAIRMCRAWNQSPNPARSHGWSSVRSLGIRV